MKTSTQWDSMYMKFLELEENALQQRQLQVRKTRKTVICCTLIQLQNKDVQTRVELWTMKASCLLLVWGEHSNNVSELSSEIIRSTTDRILESEEAASLNQEGSSLSQQDLPIFPVQMGQSVSPGANSGAQWSLLKNPEPEPETVSEGSVSKPLYFQSRRSREHWERRLDTARKTAGHVKLFQSWLSTSQFKDDRKMEDIPPEELDTFLESFFTNLTRQNGAAYGHNSFRSLRDSLERHLRAVNYPASLTLSLSFPKSQLAYRKRMKSLRNSS
ncbi:uncharacterized protein LOC135471497 isoform X3 [Liolophura sinensis]|uniref:uncharacterized protein LOC135471497 isoform X3 n=1 Tax=Liolophura sinensis TaxID=3198878 RepID=UPI003157FFB6